MFFSALLCNLLQSTAQLCLVYKIQPSKKHQKRIKPAASKWPLYLSAIFLLIKDKIRRKN